MVLSVSPRRKSYKRVLSSPDESDAGTESKRTRLSSEVTIVAFPEKVGHLYLTFLSNELFRQSRIKFRGCPPPPPSRSSNPMPSKRSRKQSPLPTTMRICRYKSRQIQVLPCEPCLELIPGPDFGHPFKSAQTACARFARYFELRCR